MADDPEVVRVLRAYRALLDGREDDLMRDMARRWLEIERSLDTDIIALAREMDDRRAAGRVITEQMIWRSDRYKAVRGQLEDQIARYNREYAISAITTAQERAALLGLDAAADAINASFGLRAPYWERVGIRAVEAMIGFAGDGSPLARLLKESYPLALDGLTQALIDGMARGVGPAQIAQDMVQRAGMGLDRALLIARTETARAYRAASLEQYRQSGVVSGYRRLVKKETACIACLMLDGEQLDLERELYDHPRGKCIAVPNVIGAARSQWETGREWFNTLTPGEQIARMGARKYELWESGEIRLDDLVRVAHSSIWGDSPRIATLAELAR